MGSPFRSSKADQVPPRGSGRTARDLYELFRSAKVTVELRGDPEASADELVTPAAAREKSVIFFEKARDIQACARSCASIIVLPLQDMADLVPASGRAFLGVSDVRKIMPVLMDLFDRRPVPAPGVHPTAVVSKKATVGEGASIGPHAVVGDGAAVGAHAVIESHVSVGEGSGIGDQTHLFPGVRVYDGVSIGARCRIHSGAVIGSDGYGYVSGPEGHQKVPQIGGVRIEDDVEIGANVTIDRGTIGDTVIGRGTKIDNLVHIAHNVQIGPYSLLIAQSGIAGSARMGSWTVLAAQSGVAGHITVGDRTMIGAKSGVTKSVPPGQVISGFPARPHPEEKRIKVAMGRLPEILRDVFRLRGAILRLSRRLSAVERNSSESCNIR